MAQLIKVAGIYGDTGHSVVFVHGLSGHPYETWRRRRNNNSFWPLWLAEDVPGISVFSYGYVSPSTNWIGTSMPLLDEAAHALQVFLTDDGLSKGTITFICHSLGGLLVKQVLRTASEHRSNPSHADFADRVRQIVFIATPHTGSGKANFMQRLSFLAWPSHSARDLVANRPELRHLNFGYRELAARRVGSLSHLVYYEMTDTPAGRIVDANAADPGLPACTPVPIKADHVRIAKPRDRADLLYMQTRKFVASFASQNAPALSRIVYDEVPFSADRSLGEYTPKLIRVLILGLALFGLWHAYPRITKIVTTLDSISRSNEELREEVRNLTKLLAKKQVASLPETLSQAEEQSTRENVEKLLEPAVLKLAQMKNDPAKEAVDALRSGNTKKAEELYRKLADQEASSNRPVEAANALRSIAAFNRLSNVAKAADLYEQAANLQPTDYANWSDLGAAAIDAGRYGTAENAFRAAVRLAKAEVERNPADLDWRRALYASYAEWGNSLRIQGKMDEATRAYDAAAQVAQYLVAEAPTNPMFKRDLSISLEKQAHLISAAGDARTSLKLYQRSLELARDLERSDDPASRRDVAVALHEVGREQIKLGHVESGKENYFDGIERLEKISSEYPDNSGYQVALAQMYQALSSLLASQGKLGEADRLLKTALRVVERLATSDNSNAGFRIQLIGIRGAYGDLLLKQRKINDALTFFRSEIPIRQQILAAGQARMNFRVDTAATYYQIGDILRCQGDMTGALENFRASVDVLKGVDANADNTARKNLNLSNTRVAQLLSNQSASCAGYLR